MAHPKRKHSHSRTRKRRLHDALRIPQLIKCSHCQHLKLPHRICPFCGYYDNREVIKVEKKEEKKKTR